MKLFRTLLILLAVSGSFSAWAAAPPAGLSLTAPATVNKSTVRIAGTVVGVVDGDTIDVEIVLRNGDTEFRFVIRIRLLADTDGRGCWCPESRTKDLAEKKRGLAAKEAMKSLALGKPCVVVFAIGSNHLIDYMTLERFLAVVEIEGKSIGETQIKSKHASSSKGGTLGK